MYQKTNYSEVGNVKRMIYVFCALMIVITVSFSIKEVFQKEKEIETIVSAYRDPYPLITKSVIHLSYTAGDRKIYTVLNKKQVVDLIINNTKSITVRGKGNTGIKTRPIKINIKNIKNVVSLRKEWKY